MTVIQDRVFRGSSADLVLLARIDNGILVDVDAEPTVVVTNPRGTIVASGGVATKETVGTYVYQFQSQSTDILGWYRAAFTVLVEGRTEVVVIRFQVVAI